MGILLQRSQEVLLLLEGLEASVSVLAGGVDEFQIDLLHSLLSERGKQRLKEDAIRETAALSPSGDQVQTLS